jgi:hypothetical protein
MRKNILALSIATMIGGLGMANAAVFDATIAANTALASVATTAGVAAATVLEVAPGGIGHSLITPYYTVQGGNMTVLSIVNTDPTNGKAVKVRFRGGSNSDDVLDFQVFMSPNDHWSAAISKNAVTGYAMLTTADRTCTVPPIPAAGQTFTAGRLPAYATATDLANMTAEGYVEIFNMADIPVNAVTTGLFQSILHAAGVPRNCNATAVQVTPLTDAATAAAAVANGFGVPTTGLFGNWTVINVAQTTTYSGEMTAVRAAVAAGGANGYGNYVYSPQSAAGVGATIDTLTADPLLRSAGNAWTAMDAGGNGTGTIAGVAIPAAFYDLPDMSTPYISTGTAPTATSPLAQAFNMTTALAVTSLSNEYTNEASLTASTDWTFSMPTRRYSVGVVYGATAATNARRFSSVAGNMGRNSAAWPLVGPESTTHTQYFYTGNTTLTSGGLICVNAAGQTFFDREETGSVSSAAVFSPNNVTTFQFCGETSVTSFSQSSASTLGSLLNPVSVNAMANGWARIVTTTGTNSAANAAAPPVVTTTGTIGLPITGAAFLKLNNPAAAVGKAGTYGLTFNHRYTK